MDKLSRLVTRFKRDREDSDYYQIEELLRGTLDFLVYGVIKPLPQDVSDYLQVARIATLSAIETWDENRGEFKNYAFVVAKFSLLTQAAKDSKARQQIIYKDEIEPEEFVFDSYKIDSVLEMLLRELVPHDDAVILKLFAEGYRYKEIAKKLGIPIKAVDISLQHTRDAFKEYEVLFPRSVLVDRN